MTRYQQTLSLRQNQPIRNYNPVFEKKSYAFAFALRSVLCYRGLLEITSKANEHFLFSVPFAPFPGSAIYKNTGISSVAIHTCTAGFCSPTTPAYPQYRFSIKANFFQTYGIPAEGSTSGSYPTTIGFEHATPLGGQVVSFTLVEAD